MLRAVFIGFDNRLNRVIEHWLSQHTDLAGCVWVPWQKQWRQSTQGKVDFIRRRIQRRGVIKAFDEALFYLLYHRDELTSSNSVQADAMMEEYFRAVGGRANTPSIHPERINDPAVLEYLRELKPDVIFAHCLNQYFGKKLRSIARHGVYLWHVGITPEYKGVYSPFWTLHNADFENFGYSLIHINDELDAGNVYVQGRIDNVDIAHDNHHLIEHKIIFASFPAVGQFIKDLENGTAAPIQRQNAKPGYYSYPGITDFIRQRLRVRRAVRSGLKLKRTPALSDLRANAVGSVEPPQ